MKTLVQRVLVLLALPVLLMQAGGASDLASLSPVPVPDAMASPATPSRRIVINTATRTLWLYQNNRLIRAFPVGVGRRGFETPLGTFRVIRKVTDPGWENPYKPGGMEQMTPGEANPLGSRWIGFHRNDKGEFGIHGTNKPGSIVSPELAGTSCNFVKEDIFDCAYEHSIYETCYRYRGRAVGHSADGDARLLSAGLVLVAAACVVGGRAGGLAGHRRPVTAGSVEARSAGPGRPRRPRRRVGGSPCDPRDRR